jgi:hypothetical protein
MALHTCTECVFDVEDGWVDDTGYSFENGSLSVVMGPYVAKVKWPGKLDQAVETFRLATPEYELVERRVETRPVAGSDLLAHRIGGPIDRFELNVFWPLGDMIWAFRVRAPRASEELCWQTAERFLDSYEPIDPAEATP